jgi:GntR family transcriptional repressor for pyruvate dehydrogenase complex
LLPGSGYNGHTIHVKGRTITEYFSLTRIISAMPTRIRRLSLGPIASATTASALADVLRERILAGDVSEGTALPPERTMVDETGLGRGSVREALRVLEGEGLIRTKTGRNGGTFTTLPSERGMARSVSQFVRGRRVPIRALLEARTAIEPDLAYLAARNRTADDIALIAQAYRDMEAAPGDPEFGYRNLTWHFAVANASHNELLVAFLTSIAGAIAHESAAHGFDGRAFGEVRSAVMRAHLRINEAIEAGDADAAKRRMERHLNAYAATGADAGDADVAVV